MSHTEGWVEVVFGIKRRNARWHFWREGSRTSRCGKQTVADSNSVRRPHAEVEAELLAGNTGLQVCYQCRNLVLHDAEVQRRAADNKAERDTRCIHHNPLVK